MMTTPRVHDVFVGRDPEIGFLKEAILSAAEGRGSIISLSGEPGIGKSRLCEEAARMAADGGLSVAWGVCSEHNGAPAYWPWIQVLRSIAPTMAADEHASALAPQLPYVAELIPELRPQMPDIPEPIPLENAEAARFRLLDGVATYLQTSAAFSPILVILDDIHWADAASLELLEFLSNGIDASRCLILVAYRDTDVARSTPLGRALGGLARTRGFNRHSISPLSNESVEQLISASGGTSLPRTVIDQIVENTDGNPFFARESLQLIHATYRGGGSLGRPGRDGQ